MQTSEKYYGFMNSKDAIHSLSTGHKRSKDDVDKIKDHWLLSGSPPSIQECIEIIKLSGLVQTEEMYTLYKWQHLNKTEL